MKKAKLFLFTLIAFLVVGFAVNVDALEVTEDLTLDADVNEEIVIPEGKTVTLNLGGKTITAPSGKVAITNNGILTIEGNGNVIANGGYAVLNHGSKLTINGGTYSKTDPSKTQSLISNGWYTNSENTSGAYSEMIINDGSFDGGSFTAIKNDAYGKMTINGGTITSTHSSAGVQEAGKSLTINGGTFDAVVYVMNWASVENDEKTTEINGGTFNKAVNIKATNESNVVKASKISVSIDKQAAFNSNLNISNTGAPSGTLPIVIEKFDVKKIGGSLTLGGKDINTRMPAVNLDGMTINGQLTLSYVEASTVKNSTIKSDIKAESVTLENVTAKTLVATAPNSIQTVKDSNIVWIKQGASHPVTLNVTDSTIGKIAPSSNGNTIMYIDVINLDGVTIKSDENNNLATGELIVNGGNVTIKDSSVEKVSIPKKPKADVNITVEEGSVVNTISNNRLPESTTEANINLPETYTMNEDGTVIMPISKANITLSKTSYQYTGKSITPSVTVKYGTKILVKDTDYTVSYKNNTNIGTATVIIEGKGNFTGTVNKTFTITGIELTKAKITGIYDKIYNKKYQKQSNIVVKLNGKTLKEGKDYTLTYKNHKNIGKAKVVIEGKGLYSGKVTKYYKINPVKIAIKSLVGKKKALKVSYYVPAGNVTYQIRYKQKGTKNWKTISTGKTAYKIKKLKSKKNYKLRVRAVKKVDGVMYYGAWSEYKQVKVK